jgi:hypothetical protein
MLFGADDLGDDEILQARARIADAFDFQADGGELGGNRFRIGIGIEMLFQPGQRELHLDSPPSKVGISRAEKP